MSFTFHFVICLFQMEQNLNAVMPPLASQINSVEVTFEERITILEKSTKDAVMKGNHKKKFLQALVRLKPDILDAAGVFDSLNNTALRDSLELKLPSTKTHINKSSKKELAVIIANLHDTFQILLQHLSTQQERVNSATSNLRESSRSKRKSDPVYTHLRDYQKLMKMV